MSLKTVSFLAVKALKTCGAGAKAKPGSAKKLKGILRRPDTSGADATHNEAPAEASTGPHEVVPADLPTALGRPRTLLLVYIVHGDIREAR